jgi:hypothetical protein
VIVAAPTFEAMPSTSALPLTCTPGPNTMSAFRSGAASWLPMRWPAACESVMPASAVLAARIPVAEKFTAVSTQLPSATPPLPISPAVEQPMRVESGRAAFSAARKALSVKNGTAPNTVTSCGLMPAS